jgi:hypothetical protein
MIAGGEARLELNSERGGRHLWPVARCHMRGEGGVEGLSDECSDQNESPELLEDTE